MGATATSFFVFSEAGANSLISASSLAIVLFKVRSSAFF